MQRGSAGKGGYPTMSDYRCSQREFSPLALCIKTLKNEFRWSGFGKSPVASLILGEVEGFVPCPGALAVVELNSRFGARRQIGGLGGRKYT
ncbi:hypothetical protein BJP34_17245 [Moorena producens PAL-8-15-08-1]|uniref:Uncharacterized protein n=1 Tax=Moorena producens PAL-8-15-08-1 TaxID=1458985 RepID=A0A1D8TTI6_9CYAN|nr:hypothetical protein BJP34_17245 [Moorena producens PAL-8-15-08-1]